MKKLRNVLSLFDGMSCGRLALDRAGVEYDKYYASEIDKHAIKVATHNYPDTIELGDINNWKEWSIDWSQVDLILAGSPCQGFSFAGKQLAFDDPRSKLFFVFVDILRLIQSVNPGVKFLLENVRMKKEHQQVISDLLGVEPVCINSALVSAQNRVRYYWCSWSVSQPEDMGVVLKDILEDGANLMRQKARGNNRGFEKNVDKAPTLSASSWQDNNHIAVVKNRGELQPRNDKSMCLDANYHKGADNHGQRTLILKEKSNTVRSGGRGSTDRHEWDSVYKDYHYRKLTPVECERLQTVPDNYTVAVSNTQRYRMLGNGWTVDVIVHILKGLPE